MIREFTATVYIFYQSQVLLHYHKKFNKWMPPGGHVEKNESLSMAAIREVKEETRLDIELIYQENLWIDEPHAKTLPRPYFCLLEEIPAKNEMPAHQHMDAIFLAKPSGSLDDLHSDFQWFTMEETLEINLFSDTKILFQHLMKSAPELTGAR